MKPRIVLTGASGYTGSRVANALVEAGHDVHVLLRAQGAETYLGTLAEPIIRHIYEEGAGEVHRLVVGLAPAAICHLAAVSEGTTHPENIRRLVESNILFGTELMEAAVACGCPSMVLAGTYWQHLDGPALAPNSLYAATKIALHAIAQYYKRLRGLRVAELILFDIYGPGDRRGKILSLFDRAAGAAEPMDLTAGEQLISPCHVDDVAAAFARALELLGDGSSAEGVVSYAVPGPDMLTLRQMASIYEAVRGARLNARWGVRPYPHGQIFRPHVGKTLPGWSPRYSFEAGLRHIYYA
jgi:nucleoside-diphosphate-sugar epimerase